MTYLIKKLQKAVDEYSAFEIPTPNTKYWDDLLKEFEIPFDPMNKKLVDSLSIDEKKALVDNYNRSKEIKHEREISIHEQKKPHLENLRVLHESIITVLTEIILKLHELYQAGSEKEIEEVITSVDTICQQTINQESDGYEYLKTDFKLYVDFIRQVDYSLKQLPSEGEGKWVAFAADSSRIATTEIGEYPFLTKTLLYYLYSAPATMRPLANSITKYKELLRETSNSIGWNLRINEHWVSLMENEIKLLSKLGVLYYSSRSGEIKPNRFGEFLIYEAPYEELQFKQFCDEVTEILSRRPEEFTNDIIAWSFSAIPSEKELEAFVETQKCLRAKQKVDQIRKLLKSEYGADLLG